METELSASLDVGCERKRRLKQDSREPSWDNLNEGAVVN